MDKDTNTFLCEVHLFVLAFVGRFLSTVLQTAEAAHCWAKASRCAWERPGQQLPSSLQQ